MFCQGVGGVLVDEFRGVLVDTRDARRFADRREILDLKAGHIPEAINIPVREILNDD